MIRNYKRGGIFLTNYNLWARKSSKVNYLNRFIISTLVFSSQEFYSFFLSRVCIFRWKLKKLKMFMTPFFLGFNLGLLFLTKVPFLHLQRSKKIKNMSDKNKKKTTKRKSRLAWKRRNVKKKKTSNHIYIHKNTFYLSKNLRSSKIYNTPKVTNPVLKYKTPKKRLAK